MGVSIKDIIIRKKIDLDNFQNKIVCIDTYNMLFQFLTTIRQADGSLLKDNGGVTSHLSGILYRITKLLKKDIKPIFVFDGKPPIFKDEERKKRREIKEKARENLKIAEKENNIMDMKKYSSMSTELNDEIIEETKEFFSYLGLPIIIAKSEGEAQAAYMTNEENIYASVSQDYDSLLFGAKRLIRNLSNNGRRKVGNIYVKVEPELIDLEENLNNLEITREQLIMLGMLVGTDYNPKGIPKIGPKTALKLVKEFNKPEKLFEHVKWKDYFDVDWKIIYEFFLNPEIDKKDYEFKEINENKIIELLCKKHEFNEERVKKILNELKEKKKQTNLSDWF